MRNIRLAYLLAYLNASWFWLGIWVLYYLLFTDYAGIGFIETVMIATGFLFEIPTGAIADLLGKKKSLICAFLLVTIGNAIMGLAVGFYHLILSVFIINLGNAFYSGTFEAFVYDTLKQKDQQQKYEKVLSNIKTIQLLGYASSSVLGGFMYSFNHGLPFLAVAGASLLAMVISFFLIEPKVDSIKYTFQNYLKQNREGIKQLFRSKNITQQSLLLISTSSFLVIVWEVLDSIIAVDYGLTEKQLGIFWAVTFVIASVSSQLTPRIVKLLPQLRSIAVFSLIIATSYIIYPLLSVIVGLLGIILRNAAQPIIDTIGSNQINANTESKYRATTLSAFQMLKKIPYVFTAYFLGRAMDIISIKTFTFGFGLLFVLVIITTTLTNVRKSLPPLFSKERVGVSL